MAAIAGYMASDMCQVVDTEKYLILAFIISINATLVTTLVHGLRPAVQNIAYFLVLWQII